MKKIKFYQTPIQRKLLLAKIRASPSLKSIFKRKEDISDDLNKDIMQRINGMIENFATIFITGAQGTFKSSLGMTLASRFDPTYTAERISFQYQEHQDKFSKSKPKQIYQLDEQCFQRGIGSTRLVQEIQETIETLRKRQNSLIIISPERKYFSEDLFTYTLETIDCALLCTCYKNPKLHEARECACYEKLKSKIKEVYVRSVVKTNGVYIGFFVCKIDWLNPFWTEYEKAKEVFMQNIVEGKKSKISYDSIAQEIMKVPEFQSHKTKTQLKLLLEKYKPNLTINEAELLIETIQMKRKEGLI